MTIRRLLAPLLSKAGGIAATAFSNLFHDSARKRRRIQCVSFVEGDNPKASAQTPKMFVDVSLLREIEASGFVKTLSTIAVAASFRGLRKIGVFLKIPNVINRRHRDHSDYKISLNAFGGGNFPPLNTDYLLN